MASSNFKERIKQLTEKINHHNYLYYQKSAPVVSDHEFDRLYKELEELETAHPEHKLPYSPTSRVGGDITKHFETVFHKYPMLSLGNTYSSDELLEFDKRVARALGTPDYEYFCELKFDGVAISLIYENGYLSRGVTRGDGTRGDDITTNIKTVKTIPLKVHGEASGLFEVRGEIFMPKQYFIDLNKKREEAGETPLANPRNTTSGTLKMQNSRIVAERKLDCFLYSYLDDKRTFTTHEEAIQYLEKAGFNVSPTYKKCGSIDEVFEYIANWEHKRHELSVETDGVVVKVNNIDQQNELGFTAKSPRWSIAFKYKAKAATTRLNKVSYQVGRTGAITPVAELAPVILAGTTVKRASLHNANEIQRLGIRIGDTVSIEKGGEIIPKITGVERSLRPKKPSPFEYIEKCPECSSVLVREEDEAQHYCPNQKSCPPQVQGRIEHFISRNAMNIETLGPRTIHGLLAHGLIKSPDDLYRLSFDRLNNLQFLETDENGGTTRRSIQEKTANNIIGSIERSRQAPFERVLFGLGIRHVGKTIAEKLAVHFQDIDHLMKASFEEIVSVHEMGDRIAQSVISFFQDPDNARMVRSLKKAGLKMEVEKKFISDEQLKGLTFVVSGVFEGWGRDELKELIKNKGGKVSGSLSGKTNYLLSGMNTGPAKKEKAGKLGINILDEKAFNRLLSSDQKNIS